MSNPSPTTPNKPPQLIHPSSIPLTKATELPKSPTPRPAPNAILVDNDTAAEMLSTDVFRVQPAHCWFWKNGAKG